MLNGKDYKAFLFVLGRCIVSSNGLLHSPEHFVSNKLLGLQMQQ